MADAMQLLLSRLIIVDVLALSPELKRFNSRLDVTGNDLFKHLAKCDVQDADQRCHGTEGAPANFITLILFIKRNKLEGFLRYHCTIVISATGLNHSKMHINLF